MAERKTTKIEVRLSPSEKATWQAEADLQDIDVSTLIRMRMRGARTAPVLESPVDLDADELDFLRQDLALLEDEQTPEDVASWKAYAAANGISFAELLKRVVVRVNAKHL